MNIEVTHYYENSNLARQIAFGNVIFWFAGETLIALKYFHTFDSEEWSRTAFARRCLNTLSKFPRSPSDHRSRFSDKIIQRLDIYQTGTGRKPYIDMYAGKGAKAFKIVFDHAAIYFSNDKLIGFTAYDKSFKLDKHELPSMKKHLALIENSTEVNRTTLEDLFNRYFYMFEERI